MPLIKRSTTRNRLKYQYRRRSPAPLTVSRRPRGRYLKPRKKYGKKYNPSKSFQINMSKYENQNMEKKFIPFSNFTNGPAASGYLGEIPAVTIPNAGLTGADEGLSCVILQTGSQLTNANNYINTTLSSDVCWALGGYALNRGTGAVNDLVGNYINIKSTLMRININVDPVSQTQATASESIGAILPRQYRLIMVKGKRNNSVAGGASSDQGSLTGAIQTNLWINEANEERGLLDPMSVQDAFTWLINKQKFYVLKDERFNLFPNAFQKRTSEGGITNVASGPNGYAKSQRFKNYYLPIPKNKTKYDLEHATSMPVDYNYVTHTIILCKSMGGSGNPDSKGWNVQVNGLTTFLDN